MFVEIQPGVWLNTDHIITIDIERNIVDTTPGVARVCDMKKLNWKNLILKLKGEKLDLDTERR